MELGVNVVPQANGANISASFENDSVHGKITVHTPSGEMQSFSGGVSGDLGNVAVDYHLSSERTSVTIGNGDIAVRGNVQFDPDQNFPSVGVQVKCDW